MSLSELTSGYANKNMTIRCHEGIFDNMINTSGTFVDVTTNYININNSAVINNLTVTGNENVTNLYFPTSGGTASTLNFYQEASATTTAWSWGGATGATSNIICSRIGNMVQCNLPSFSLASNQNAPVLSVTPIPTQFRPATQKVLPCYYHFTRYPGIGLTAGAMVIRTDGKFGIISPVPANGGGTINSSYVAMDSTAWSWLYGV